MSERKQELLAALEGVYRGSGWKVTPAEDGTLRATGPGGVTWIGLAVVAEDLADLRLADRGHVEVYSVAA